MFPTQGSEQHMSSLRIHESTLADQLADHGLKPGDDYTLDALDMNLLRSALDYYANYLKSLKCEAAGTRCLEMLEIINSGFETVVRDVGS
jgi:hypothetical protein